MLKVISLVPMLAALSALPAQNLANIPARMNFSAMTDHRFIVPKRYEKIFWKYVSETGVPAWIACRLISEESKWRWWATNKNDDGTTDLGLMQLNDGYIKNDYEWRFNDGRPIKPLDPETNIRVGLRKLAALHRQWGNWYDAIVAWNCGFIAGAPKRSLELARKVISGGMD